MTSPAEGRATPLPIAQLLDSARAHWHGVEVAGFTVSNPGAANAVIDIRQRDGKRLSIDTPAVRYDMVSGALLEETPPSGGATATRGVL
ncbi:hypothetical protein ACNJEG_21380, partial [Mycobacterium tuberculosis]